jgi:hypothetical protein
MPKITLENKYGVFTEDFDHQGGVVEDTDGNLEKNEQNKHFGDQKPVSQVVLNEDYLEETYY